MADETLAGAPDDYEQRYMDADRAVLRARQRQPRWVPAAALMVMAWALWLAHPTLAWMWAHRDAPGVGVALAVIAGWFAVNNLALLFALLTDHITRVVLTPTHLRVHRGLWADDIALDDLTAASVEEASWWRPKHSLRGAILRRERSYLTPGVNRALRLEWRDARGRARKTWVQFEDAPAFGHRLAGGARATGVRVAPDEAGREVGEVQGAVRPASARGAGRAGG